MISGGMLKARNMPCPSFHRFGALVDLVRAQLLEHPLVADALPECDNDSVGGYPRDGIVDLAEALYEAPQRLPLLLFDGVEVALSARACECALKVGHKLVAKIITGTDRSWG